MDSIPERFVWAVELLEVNPQQHILEIGCGVGLLAEMIAGKLTTGKITAVDKSSAMIQKASKRNQRFVAKGVSEFIASDFYEVAIPTAHFDSIVAFNVNFFKKDPAPALHLIRKSLKKDGKVFICVQEPFDIDTSAAVPIVQALRTHAYEVLDVKLKKLLPTSAICIITKPISDL